MRAVFESLKFSMLYGVIIITHDVQSQTNISLRIHHPAMPWHVSDSVVLDVWRYYLCDFSCDNSIAGDCMLIESDTTIQLTCNNELSHVIIFSMGVDSLKQAKPLYSGDLNPLKNMYWTWQSGYIQLKAEGKLHRPNGDW